MPKCRIYKNRPVFCKSIINILFRQEKLPIFTKQTGNVAENEKKVAEK